MAGKIIADTIDSAGSQISLNVGNVTVLTASSTGLTTANITTANITTANITGNVLIGTSTSQTGAKLAVTGGIQGTIASGTTVASTSGTSIDFTSIPSWVKRVTVMFNAVSTNGSSNLLVQLGDSGGVEITGYGGASSHVGSGGTGAANFTTGFGINNTSAGDLKRGSFILSLADSANFRWVCSGVIADSASAFTAQTAGDKSLSATLDRIRITTVNGTDTFDSGNINILYEG
jgi:hypothetical protein